MISIDLALFIGAVFAFLVAAFPNGTNIRFEWLGFAALVLTQIL